jgi:hypothetical protein
MFLRDLLNLCFTLTVFGAVVHVPHFSDFLSVIPLMCASSGNSVTDSCNYITPQNILSNKMKAQNASMQFSHFYF